VRRFKAAEIDVAPQRLEVLRFPEQHPGARDIDVLQSAALKIDRTDTTGVDVSQGNFEIRQIA